MTLDLQQCEQNCGGGLAVFLLLCELRVAFISYSSCLAGKIRGEMCSRLAGGPAICMLVHIPAFLQLFVKNPTHTVLQCILFSFFFSYNLSGVLVVAVSFFIMFFDVELPNELKGFLFYAQVFTTVEPPIRDPLR